MTLAKLVEQIGAKLREKPLLRKKDPLMERICATCGLRYGDHCGDNCPDTPYTGGKFIVATVKGEATMSSRVTTVDLAQNLTGCLKASVNVLLCGRPGVGKSTLAHQIVRQAQGQQSYFSIVLPEDTPVAELRGHYLPQGTEWRWHDGPVTAAIRHGSPLILDELSHLSPEAQTFMHAALDDSPITLPTGETVQKTKKMFCIATQNDGADLLRPALRDRFPVIITVEKPLAAAYLGLPSEMRKPAQGDVEGNGGSLRTWYAFAELQKVLASEAAAELLWPGRGQELLNAVKLAA